MGSKMDSERTKNEGWPIYLTITPAQRMRPPEVFCNLDVTDVLPFGKATGIIFNHSIKHILVLLNSASFHGK